MSDIYKKRNPLLVTIKGPDGEDSINLSEEEYQQHIVHCEVEGLRHSMSDNENNSVEAKGLQLLKIRRQKVKQ